MGRPLRSKTPEGIIQEVYGLLLAHYLIRASMHEVALQADIDLDRLSFVFALGLILTLIPLALGYDEPARQIMQRTFAHDVVRFLLPPREDRSNPRVVKRRLSKFRRKTRNHRGVWCRLPFVHAIALSRMVRRSSPRPALPSLCRRFLHHAPCLKSTVLGFSQFATSPPNSSDHASMSERDRSWRMCSARGKSSMSNASPAKAGTTAGTDLYGEHP
ncbi:MAG: hypothetical protein DLM70_02005 [Chloroflexi bacterium]|nr:MAG: hypothetical protein DLM70_02005 [Chloroflexota bacterium]